MSSLLSELVIRIEQDLARILLEYKTDNVEELKDLIEESIFKDANGYVSDCVAYFNGLHVEADPEILKDRETINVPLQIRLQEEDHSSWNVAISASFFFSEQTIISERKKLRRGTNRSCYGFLWRFRSLMKDGDKRVDYTVTVVSRFMRLPVYCAKIAAKITPVSEENRN